MNNEFKRVTGLLVIEVVNSNPNGDPDRESDPRMRDNGRGEISPVSFKRKLRDLLEKGAGPVHDAVLEQLRSQAEIPDGYQFKILESRGRDRKAIQKEMGDIKCYDHAKYLESEFVKNYWDARLFGNTFLEDGANKEFIKTGIAQFGMGLSIAPVHVIRQTNTNKAGVQEGKNQGMAPLAYRVVEHGVYLMPFYINPSMADKSGCKPCDIELLKLLIPFAYDHTRSAIRPDVRIRHAWWMEHQNALGSCPDFKLVEAMAPKRKGNVLEPSQDWGDYEDVTELPSELKGKVTLIDLIG